MDFKHVRPVRPWIMDRPGFAYFLGCLLDLLLILSIFSRENVHSPRWSPPGLQGRVLTMPWCGTGPGELVD